MQFIDLVLSASEVTALHEVVDLLPPAAGGSVQLERPEKVGGVLEVGTNVEDLVNQILDTDDSELAELVLDDVIGCNGSAITVHLDKSTLVDQIADRLEVRRSPGDVGLADPQHVDGRLVKLDEDAVVDLPQPEELQHLLHLRGDLVDTANPHHKGQLRVGRHVVTSLLASLTTEPDFIPLLVLVLLGILSARLKMFTRLAFLSFLALSASLARLALFSACR